jgi:SAM-dependent methyltransferase
MNPVDRSGVLASYTQPITLGARASIYAYRRDHTDLRAAIAELIDLRPGARVLDVGCGETPYFAALAARGPAIMVGLDASAEMLQRARSHPIVGQRCLVQGVLDALPFRAQAWDVVLAAHSLYHAENPSRVLAALPRLLRTGGCLYLVLNGRDHLQEIRDLTRTAGHPGLLRESARLTGEDAIDLLAQRHFVTTRWFEDELHIPEPEPVIAYVDSTRAMYETQLSDRITWPTMLNHFANLVQQRITHTDVFRARTRTAVIRCE